MNNYEIINFELTCGEKKSPYLVGIKIRFLTNFDKSCPLIMFLKLNIDFNFDKK